MIIGFLSTMAEAFDGQRVSEGLASRSLGFFLTGSAQNAYINVVYRQTHDPNHVPITWPLIVNSILNCFISDDFLRNEHHAVTSARIKQSETYINFAERLHDMSRRCLNVFSNT